MASLNESLEQSISIYPNPIQSGTCLNIEGDGIKKIQLISPDGKSIKTDRNFEGSIFEIPENVSSGTYILQIESEKQLLNKPLIIIR
jgi:hypothetical protein